MEIRLTPPILTIVRIHSSRLRPPFLGCTIIIRTSISGWNCKTTPLVQTDMWIIWQRGDFEIANSMAYYPCSRFSRLKSHVFISALLDTGHIQHWESLEEDWTICLPRVGSSLPFRHEEFPKIHTAQVGTL